MRLHKEISFETEICQYPAKKVGTGETPRSKYPWDEAILSGESSTA